MCRKTYTYLFAPISSLLIFLSPLSQAQTRECPMSYSPQFLECMAGHQEVVVIGTQAPASSATPDYLLTKRNVLPRDMQGRALMREEFCRSEQGNILATKATCELSASERDETRQSQHCTNISLSWNGIGWTNPCRDDSALTYRTDIARCASNYQNNMNSYNAICRR